MQKVTVSSVVSCGPPGRESWGEGYTLGSSHFRLVTLAFTSVLSGFCFSYFTFMSLSHAIFKAFFFL